MLTINRERLLNMLAELARIGQVPEVEGGGLNRRVFSPAEREARRTFTHLAQNAGMGVVTDAAANLSARLNCGPAGAPVLLLGSHLDTVPNGGRYDGALGVLAALEVLTVIRENGRHLPFNLEAIAFTDEEGSFADFFGSRALSGQHSDGSIGAFLARANDYPADLAAMEELLPGGLQPHRIEQAARMPQELAGYLELHIEQGPRLEHAQRPIGVVSAIFGRSSFRLTLIGRPDHAGTTPMALRADALLAASHFVTRAVSGVRQRFPQAVITCGGISVEPGVYNVVPGRASLLVEYRAATSAELVGIDTLLTSLIEEISAAPDLTAIVQQKSRHAPVAMDESMQAAICHAADVQGLAWLDLPSGAGHDALMMAGITPAGMIFVPSIGGRSHCPDEDTNDDDLVAGAAVLLGTVLHLAETD